MTPTVGLWLNYPITTGVEFSKAQGYEIRGVVLALGPVAITLMWRRWLDPQKGKR